MRLFLLLCLVSTSLFSWSQDWLKEYDDYTAPDFEKGPYLVKKDGKYGFVTHEGTPLIPIEYENVITYIDRWNGAHEIHKGFTPSGFAVLKKDGKEGMINLKGEIIIPFDYEEIGTHDDYWLIDNGLIAVKKGKKWGFYDTTGTMVMKPTFACVGADDDCTPYFTDGLMTAVTNFHKCKAVINTEGKVIIQQGDYDFIKLLPGGFVEVTQQDYKGVADKNGTLIIGMNFSEIQTNTDKEGKIISFTCYDEELRHYVDFDLTGKKIRD